MTLQSQTAALAANRGGREDQLQFLRFLAFLNVFIGHGEQWLFFPYRTSHCATAAVSFFFMLSGLVAGYSLAGKPVVPSGRNIAVFLWKKIRKVYPLYFLTTMFAVMFSPIPSLLMASDFDGAGPQLVQLGKNLLLIQSWFPENAHSFNTVGWFLSVLMFLYALSLPFGWLLNKLGQSKFWWLWIPGLFGGIFCGIVFYCYGTQNLDMSFWHYQFPPARAGEYFLGMILGFMAVPGKKWLPDGKSWKAVYTVLEIGVLLFWYYSLSRPGNYWRNNIVSWVIPELAVLTIFLAGKGWCSDLFRRRELVYLGDISFECYLLHQLVLIRFAVNLQGQPGSLAGNVFVILFSLLFSVLTASYLHGRGKQKRAK